MCSVPAIAQVKLMGDNKFPESAKGAVERAQIVAAVVGRTSPEILFEDYAVVVAAEGVTLYRGDVSLPVAIKPAGKSDLLVYGKDIKISGGSQSAVSAPRGGGVSISMSNTMSMPNAAIAEGVFEAGKVYTVEHTKRIGFMKSAAIVEMTDDAIIEQAQKDAADIVEKAKAYLEYMNAHPNELDGVYMMQGTALIIKNGTIHFGSAKRMESGKNTPLDGEKILYDGETIIIIPKEDTPVTMGNVWYYRFVDDKMEVVTVAAELLRPGLNGVQRFTIESRGTE